MGLALRFESMQLHKGIIYAIFYDADLCCIRYKSTAISIKFYK